MDKLIKRLISLGMSHYDAKELSLSLDVGYISEDCMPIINKYPQIKNKFLFSGKIYRSQLLTEIEFERFQKGNDIPFDSEYKAWSKSKSFVENQFSDIFGHYSNCVILAYQCSDALDAAKMFNMGRWKTGKEVWCSLPFFSKNLT
jgi:hypothetical protein